MDWEGRQSVYVCERPGNLCKYIIRINAVKLSEFTSV